MNFQICGALNHVLVGNDVARWIDNETGAETLQSLTNLAWANAIIAEELRVKIFDRIPHRTPHDPLGINIDDRWQDFRHRKNGWLRSRIGLAKARFCLC
jgi:hypothetical protein